MKSLSLSPLTLGFVIGTRAAGAFGAGLLLSSRIPEDKRRRIGLGLVALGAATTIPAVMSIRAGRNGKRHRADRIGAGRDHQLIGTERFPRKGDEDERD